MLVLESGEKVMESITQYANEFQISGGQVSGIGALCNLELGYYHLPSKDYKRKTFNEGEYELITMSGNLSLKENIIFAHVHAVFSSPGFNCIGGHVFEAEVAVTAEIFIVPFDVKPIRKLNPNIGLGLICEFK